MVTLTQKGDQAISFTATANNQAISGGQLVKAMSVGQISADWATNPLEVDIADALGDANLCVGLALTNAASGEKIAVAMEGFYTMTAGGTLAAGNPVTALVADGGSAVVTTGATVGSKVIGHALSTAADAERVAVALRL